MDRGKIIYNVLKQVDWDFIFSCVKHIDFNLHKTKITKSDLILDLTDMLKNVLVTRKTRLVTDIWTITCEYSGKDQACIEVVFTPIIIWSDNFDTKKSPKVRENRLKERLELALEIEDYHKAAKIQKSLDKLQSKLK